MPRVQPQLPPPKLLLSTAILTASPALAWAQSTGASTANRPALEVLALLGSCALLLILPQLYANAASLKFGIPTMLGNREGFPELTGWMGRARRTELNLQTNLIPFAVVVLALATFSITTGATRFGALLFLAARVVHAFAYIAGIPGLRSLALYAGLAGTLIAAWPLIAALM